MTACACVFCCGSGSRTVSHVARGPNIADYYRRVPRAETGGPRGVERAGVSTTTLASSQDRQAPRNQKQSGILSGKRISSFQFDTPLRWRHRLHIP